LQFVHPVFELAGPVDVGLCQLKLGVVDLDIVEADLRSGLHGMPKPVDADS
jgi:hypothetical protein